jgi:glycosyltransferase involved in cell wall biosynthesis
MPLFSVLLPSRNRLELLKHAVGSVLRQDLGDFEIIVSDNASTEGYAAYVAALNDPRIRCLCSDVSLPVTDNWNRALDAARGQYIIMLGDDDALAPGYLARVAALIPAFAEPDVVYSMSYHYGYPGVFAAAPKGYLAELKPQPIYNGSPTPYLHDPAESRRFGRLALRFRHLFAFNSQYYAWSRRFIDSLAHHGPFFQSPYPDFYSSFMTMLCAQRIVVTPDPGVLIGISPQSFGFYLQNDQLAAGNQMLNLSERDADAVRDLSPDAAAALAFPGSSHYRNWLIAALFVLQRMGPSPDLWVDFRRYRRLQLIETAHQRHYLRRADPALAGDLRGSLSAYERRLYEKLSWWFAITRRVSGISPEAAHDGLFTLQRIYRDSLVRHCDLPDHQNISDAWHWLAAQDSRAVVAAAGAPVAAPPSAARSAGRLFARVRRAVAGGR